MAAEPGIKSKLWMAIRSRNFDQLKLLAKSSGYKFSDLRLNNYSLITCALTVNRADIVTWLMNEGCPVNRLRDGSSPTTPLHLAVLTYQNELVEGFLKRGAAVNARNDDGETPLHIACKARNVAAVGMLLERRHDLVTLADEEGTTAIHLAAEKNCLSALELLLGYPRPQLEDRTSKQNFEGFTALHVAIASSASPKLVDTLILAGADLRAIVGQPGPSGCRHHNLDYEGYSPLHLAVGLGNYELSDLLLKRSADVNLAIESNGFTPIHLALQAKNEKMVKLLTDFGADFRIPTKEGKKVLHLAIEHDCTEFVKLLVTKADADVNEKTNEGETPLHMAVKKINIEVVNLLLAHNADINSKNHKNQTPLHLAAAAVSTEITKILLKKGAKIDEIDDENETPLAVAIRCRIFRSVLLILSYKPNVNNPANRSAFLSAVEKFNFYKGIVRLLYKYGFRLVDENENYDKLLEQFIIGGHVELVQHILKNLKAKNYDYKQNNKLIHNPITKGNVKMVALLIKYGFSAELKDNEGQMLLYNCVKGNHSEMLDLLLSNGAEAHTNYIWTAARFQDMKTMYYLLKHGKDINTCDSAGTTMLHFAVWHKHFEFVKFLLNEGANINCRGFGGNTALHLAAANCRGPTSSNIIKLLLKYQADINIRNDRGDLPVQYLLNHKCISFRIAFEKTYKLSREDWLSTEDTKEGVASFVKHVVLLTSINKDVHPHNLQNLSQFENFEQVHKTCLNEIEKIKEQKIIDNVSFYDLLVKKSNSLAAYARNEKFNQAFISSNYEDRFPMYCDVLRDQFRISQYRFYLLENAYSTLVTILKCPMHRIACDEIFRYLNTQDLKNICSIKRAVENNNSDDLEPPKKKQKPNWLTS